MMAPPLTTRGGRHHPFPPTPRAADTHPQHQPTNQPPTPSPTTHQHSAAAASGKRRRVESAYGGARAVVGKLVCGWRAGDDVRHSNCAPDPGKFISSGEQWMGIRRGT